MRASITYRGREITNPVVRGAAVVLLAVWACIMIPIGFVLMVLAIVFYPVAVVLHRVGCPGITINGRGRTIMGHTLVNYDVRG